MQPNMHFELLKREKKYRGRIIDLTIDYVRYPSGNESIREIVEHPGGAVIVPLFENGDILLVRQYRHPFGKEVIELPAGKLDKGEDPLHCAQRELQEETGYASSQWKPVTAMLATPGFCDEILHIFTAKNISPSPQGRALEEGEASLQLMRVPMSEAVAMIESHEIVDGKTIVGILLADHTMKAQ